MREEVMQHFGLTAPFEQAGYYESAHHQALIEQIRGAITESRLVAVCGAIGSGKTVLLQRLRQILKDEDKISVSTSFALEKHRLGRPDFITALWYDISTEIPARMPNDQTREQELCDWVRKQQKPVALFIDDAHELTRRALTDLRQLMTLIESNGGRLSVVLAGQPTLRQALRYATRQQIGHRTDVVALKGMAGSQHDYIRWLLEACAADPRATETVITGAAIDQLATEFHTPLHIQRHLRLALEASYQVGERRVSVEVVESVLDKSAALSDSRRANAMKRWLARAGSGYADITDVSSSKNGYLAEIYATKP
jgi:type II secretory pathway predicted ATPase ExeA